MRIAFVIAGLVAAGGMCGCYHRVVASKGLGGRGGSVQEPYRSDTAADRAVDNLTGHGQRAARGADTMPLTGRSRWSADSTGGGSRVRCPSRGSEAGMGIEAA